MARRTVQGCLVLLSFTALVTAAVGCGSENQGPTAEYKASIRRTSFGIPHILASDLGSAGFGLGYAAAQDYVCVLADQIVKVRSERSRYFGPGDKDANVETDFGILDAKVHADAEAAYSTLSGDSRAVVDGFVAGYNHYLDQTPASDLPVDCANADWEKSSLEIRTDLPSRPLWVEGDSVRPRQIVDNLLSNAVEFAGESGSVTVDLSTEDGTAVLRVRDTGGGIEPELLPHIFEVLRQSGQNLDRSQGGLGSFSATWDYPTT